MKPANSNLDVPFDFPIVFFQKGGINQSLLLRGRKGVRTLFRPPKGQEKGPDTFFFFGLLVLRQPYNFDFCVFLLQGVCHFLCNFRKSTVISFKLLNVANLASPLSVSLVPSSTSLSKERMRSSSFTPWSERSV